LIFYAGVHPTGKEGESKRSKKEGEWKATRRELAMEPNPLYIRTLSSDDQNDEHRTQPFCILQKKLKFRQMENMETKNNMLL
jgi:hypothetical protein